MSRYRHHRLNGIEMNKYFYLNDLFRVLKRTPDLICIIIIFSFQSFYYQITNRNILIRNHHVLSVSFITDVEAMAPAWINPSIVMASSTALMPAMKNTIAINRKSK